MRHKRKINNYLSSREKLLNSEHSSIDNNAEISYGMLPDTSNINFEILGTVYSFEWDLHELEIKFDKLLITPEVPEVFPYIKIEESKHDFQRIVSLEYFELNKNPNAISTVVSTSTDKPSQKLELIKPTVKNLDAPTTIFCVESHSNTKPVRIKEQNKVPTFKESIELVKKRNLSLEAVNIGNEPAEKKLKTGCSDSEDSDNSISESSMTKDKNKHLKKTQTDIIPCSSELLAKEVELYKYFGLNFDEITKMEEEKDGKDKKNLEEELPKFYYNPVFDPFEEEFIWDYGINTDEPFILEDIYKHNFKDREETNYEDN